MVANPFFGKLSDRTASPLGMRRPWMIIGLAGGSLGILIVALAPSIPVVLAGWCIAQLFFNALLAAMVAVMPDQVPTVQRGLVSGVLGVCMPVGSVCGTFVVKLFTGHLLAMFLGPCAIAGFFILLFAVSLNDRRLAKAEKPAWSLREFASTFYVNPRKNPDFAWAFASRFMFVMAYAFLVTYQAYYLLDKIGTAKADVPQQIFLGTLAQSAVIVAASLIGGRLSDRTGRRKIFVFTASIVYGLALFMIAVASDFNGFLVGMAISGLGFGVYLAVDLALVVDVLPGKSSTAKDLGVFNIAGALPFSIAPAIAPAILAIGGGSYGVLYMVAGLCAITGAARDPARAPRPVSPASGSTAIGARPGCIRGHGRALGGPGRVVLAGVRPRRPGRRAACWRGVHCGGDRGRPEALDDQPHAQRQLPGSHRDCGELGGAQLEAAQQRCEDSADEERGADEPDHGNDAGHEPGAVHQGAQQQCVEGRHEALREQERPVVDRDVRRAGGDQRGRVCSGRSAQVLPQGHQRQQADDAGEDHAGFQDAGGDKAQRGAFVLPFDHRVQRDGGADAGQRDDHLEEGAHGHARVGAGAEDPVLVVLDGAVEGEGGDRDEGDQVEDARDERGLPGRAHRDSFRLRFPCRGSDGDGHVGLLFVDCCAIGSRRRVPGDGRVRRT